MGADQHSARTKKAIFGQSFNHAKVLWCSSYASQHQSGLRLRNQRLAQAYLVESLNQGAHTLFVRPDIYHAHPLIQIAIGKIPIFLVFPGQFLKTTGKSG